MRRDVEQQCTTQHTNSAPGCDTILPVLLRHVGGTAYKALSALYTYSWQHSVLPQQWTEANVMALWKGKGARVRPVFISSHLHDIYSHPHV